MPPELEPVISDPRVIEALIAAAVATLGTITVLLGWTAKRLTAVQKKVVATNEQVTNEHKTNLRDDVTRLSQKVDLVLDEMSSEKESREYRDKRAETQIDGLRDDVRALTARAESEHKVIHDRITALKDCK